MNFGLLDEGDFGDAIASRLRIYTQPRQLLSFQRMEYVTCKIVGVEKIEQRQIYFNQSSEYANFTLKYQELT
jgi:hypothetical protein